MYYVYILKNLGEKHYIGSTNNVEKRLKKHNEGGSVWTRKYRPWKIVYTEEFETKVEAMRREKVIKSYKGGNKFKQLLGLIG